MLTYIPFPSDIWSNHAVLLFLVLGLWGLVIWLTRQVIAHGESIASLTSIVGALKIEVGNHLTHRVTAIEKALGLKNPYE